MLESRVAKTKGNTLEANIEALGIGSPWQD
jgi:hypothetical protein